MYLIYVYQCDKSTAKPKFYPPTFTGATVTGPVDPAQAGPIFAFAAILKLLFGWRFSIETILLYISTLFQSLSQYYTQ